MRPCGEGRRARGWRGRRSPMAHSPGKRACRRGVHVARRRRAGWPTMRPIRPGPATHRQRTVFMNDGGKPPIRGPSRRIAGPPAWCRQPSAGPEPAAGRSRRRNQRPCGTPARPRAGARYAVWGRALGSGGPGLLADGRPAQRCGGSRADSAAGTASASGTGRCPCATSSTTWGTRRCTKG